MADIPSLRKMIQAEEVSFGAVNGESLIYRVGAGMNFINKRQHSEKQFFANGTYGVMSVYPQVAVDGLAFMEFDAEIINAWAFIKVVGTSGTTELDIKRATASGGSFTSIFSTTPKFTSASSNYSFVDANGYQTASTGVTAPVLSTTNVNQGDALRFDIVTAMPDAQCCGVVIHYRPR